MMKTEYCVVEEKYIVGKKEYIAFGIAEIENYEDSYSVIMHLHNICSDFGMIEKILEKCNRLDISPIHLNEVITDLLNDI